jgi:cob(I)alamin adenosyltransferase
MQSDDMGETKIYTRKGDSGVSSFQGRKIWKGDPAFEALGALDELSADIGLLCAEDPKNNHEYVPNLRFIQYYLLEIGSNLAVRTTQDIPETALETLEKITDANNAISPKLTEFILPGVYRDDALAHVCRVKARHAERCVIRTAGDMENMRIACKFLNRLSSYFFALARVLTPHNAEFRRSQAKLSFSFD